MGNPARRHIFLVAGFITEVRHAANREAHARGCVLTVSGVDPRLAVNADRDLLLLAIGNLMQNAFKFTHLHTEVTLNPYAIADRILIDVKDNCGGFCQPMHARCSCLSPRLAKTGVGLVWALNREAKCRVERRHSQCPRCSGHRLRVHY